MALALSHALCVAIIMHFDLSGKWASYSMNPNRDVTIEDYKDSMKSFAFDLLFLFWPFMTVCCAYRADEIRSSQDSLVVGLSKFVAGHILGKAWAFGVHYLLHHPQLYRFHRRHHCNPRSIVASAAWKDSAIEYVIMELPSFAMTVLLFPTHFWVHLMHFGFHGWDGACGHSGFKAPGWLGFLFDGEYHYYHHAHLAVNYAEIEFLDKLFGTHHSQQPNLKKHLASKRLKEC